MRSHKKGVPSARRTNAVRGGSAQIAKKKLSATDDRTSSTAEQKRPRTELDDSSDDEEDRPTDYELLLSTIKPLRKKPLLERRDEKDHVVGSCASRHQTEEEKGQRIEDEKTEGQGLGDSDGECSDFEEVEDSTKKGATCTTFHCLFPTVLLKCCLEGSENY